MTTTYHAYPPSRNPGCLVQALWFVFLGSWLTPIWVTVAWVLLVSVVGIPVGVMMLNRVPRVLALRDPGEVQMRATQIGKGVYVYQPEGAAQRPFLVRAVYFLLVGWWLSALWMALAYAVCCTIIGLPLGVWMFDLVPALVSLRR
jgi:uncharacterized membrane protein YccF (DUF307 family)